MNALSIAAIIVATVTLVLIAVWVGWRFTGLPCPWWLVPLLENPYFNAVAGASMLLERADVRPGMRVLDAGCGPGRLTLAAARRVGEEGHVTALDIQAKMLEQLAVRLHQQNISNVEMIPAGLGVGKLPRESYDVALLVTVLGEIHDQPAALKEILESLRAGGVLSVTEVLPDPHYQSVRRVRKLAEEAGFEFGNLVTGIATYTANFLKPGAEQTIR